MPVARRAQADVLASTDRNWMPRRRESGRGNAHHLRPVQRTLAHSRTRRQAYFYPRRIGSRFLDLRLWKCISIPAHRRYD